MSTAPKTALCAYCSKPFIVAKNRGNAHKYCSKTCLRRSQSSIPVEKPKLKTPNVTINDVGNYQVFYKHQTGQWLTYTEASQTLDAMPKTKLKKLRAEWTAFREQKLQGVI